MIGPVVGLTAAFQADLGLALLDGEDVAGELVMVDGRAHADANLVRRRRILPRPTCPLCGTAPRIRSIEEERYVANDCYR